MTRHERALAARGWMTVAELQWLEEIARDKSLVIELGSWCGRSSIALSSAKKLICVDNWIGSKNNAEGTPETCILSEFTANLEEEIAAGTVETATGCLSNEGFIESSLIERFAGEADVVFIDACHEEAEVSRDIETALALLKEGGIICGHDYSSAWPGVVAAVTKRFGNVGRAAESIWWVQQ
jgi:predicted O-methyltransferase YrrM